EERLGPEDHGRVVRKRDLRVEQEPHAHGAPRGLDADPVDLADRHAPVRHDVALRELPHALEADVHGNARAPEVRALQPQRAHHADHDGRDDDDADAALLPPVHLTDSMRSGLPSMNPRTTGSDESRISSGVPSARIRPSWSIAIRSEIRKALVMSCVMTTPVTCSSSAIRMMSSSIMAVV